VATTTSEAPATSPNGHGTPAKLAITVLADRVLVQVGPADGERRSRAGMEGGQSGQVGGVEGIEDGLQRGQHSPVPADPGPGVGVEVELALGPDPPAAGGDGGQGAATDERVPAPALTTFHRLQQEARVVAGLHDLEEGSHRCEGVGHQLPPHRDDAVACGQGPESGDPRTDRPVEGGRAHGSVAGEPKARKKQLRLPV
jgi:hypothetical protein